MANDDVRKVSAVACVSVACHSQIFANTLSPRPHNTGAAWLIAELINGADRTIQLGDSEAPAIQGDDPTVNTISAPLLCSQFRTSSQNYTSQQQEPTCVSSWKLTDCSVGACIVCTRYITCNIQCSDVPNTCLSSHNAYFTTISCQQRSQHAIVTL